LLSGRRSKPHRERERERLEKKYILLSLHQWLWSGWTGQAEMNFYREGLTNIC